MTPAWHIPRRTILRGIGTGVALPFLEAMVMPKRTRAALDPKTNPRRLVGIWGLPSGGHGKDDPKQNCWVSGWTPDEEGPLTKPDGRGLLDAFFGRGASIGAHVKGLPFRDVSSKLTILTGLSDASASHVMNASMLGPRMISCPTVGKQYTDIDAGCRNAGVPDIGGPTIDQIAAAHFKKGQYTAVDSMVLGGDPSHGGDIRGIYGHYLSWSTGTQHVPKNVDAAAVFDKLFGGAIDPKEDKAVAALRKKNRTSVLDVVMKQARRITGRIGKEDQAKISQYFDGIRDIESQIARGDVALGCAAPERPGPANNAWLSYLDIRIKVMMDLMVKAFECDRTRVATLMYSDGNGQPTWPFLGLNKDHHTMSHWAKPDGATTEEAQAYLDTYSKWALQMLAYFMGELDSRTEVGSDGSTATLLDNSLILMSGDFSDGGHSWASTNILLGGRAGRDPMTGNWGLRAGRHVRCSPPWSFCWNGRVETYCPDSTGGNDVTQFAPVTESLRFAGERTTKDLLWGMLRTIGIPDDVITGGKPTFGYATAPLDLTFPGKA